MFRTQTGANWLSVVGEQGNRFVVSGDASGILFATDQDLDVSTLRAIAFHPWYFTL